MATDTEKGAGTDSKTEAQELTLLDQIIRDGKMARLETQQAYARDMIGEFIKAVPVPEQPGAKIDDIAAAINGRIKEIDELLSAQLNEILHDPAFQRVEATWRGLNYLVKQTETGTRLKLRVLNATRDELQKDLDKAVEFDQSQLFKKIYEEEYGTYGGAPYSALLADFEIGRHPQDIDFVMKLSQVAAAAHAPLITAAAPALFDMESFTELGLPRDLAKIFESIELVKWRSFRESEDSRYVALCLPHVLLRLPYGKKTVPVEQFDYEEDVDGKNHTKYLWGNAAWALGARITAAFARYNWCGAIRGVEGGGLVEGLPAHIFDTGEGDKALKCPTEVSITDRREKELSDLGFISLVHCKSTDHAAFFGGATANKPIHYNLDSANANARLSATLPYLLAASRFAHYIKVMMRDKVGSFLSRDDVKTFLNTWINQYILAKDDAGQELKAKYPLRDARVDVVDVAGKPGAYRATVFLRPHFQLEELTASIRLVAELPAPAA